MVEVEGAGSGHPAAKAETARHPLGLGRLSAPRVSEVLATELRAKILGGELPAGSFLPTERDLARDTGLSRASVRDAIRILEVEGLVVTRPGRGGGTEVLIPSADTLVRSLEVFVYGRGVRLRSLLEARQLIEPECAALAAERHEVEDLAALEASDQRMRQFVGRADRFLDENVRWHVAVARASRNELFMAVMAGIARFIRSGSDQEGAATETAIRDAVRAHGRVVEAIRDRDPEAARRRMDRHVCAYSEILNDQDLDKQLAWE